MARNGNDPVQQYRGTTDQHQAYTGPIGEITVDTTKKTAVVHDGATPGGHPLMREDAPDELTIMRTDDGHIQGMDIAIGGDPADLASARGQIGNTPTVGPHDFSTGMLAEKSGLYAAYQSGSTNAPFAGPYAELIARTGGQAGSILFSSGKTAGQRAALGTVSSINGFGGYNRLITEEQIGDGIRATDGILSVPEYEGATATQPGTAGLVNPATPEERDYVYHGDGTWREITSVGSGKLAHAEINTYHKRNVVVTPASFDVGELYYEDDISTTGRVFTQKVNDGIKILEDGIYNVLLEIGVNNTASITGDLVFGTKLVARESEKLSSPIVMSTSSIYVNTIAADTDSGSVTIAKFFKAGDIIAPYLAIQQGDVFNLHWVSVVLTKFPSVVSTAGSTADVAVDNVTITKNNNVLSVLPEGFVDNKSIFVNKEGKLESKSIPFDGGSIFDIVSEKYGSDFPSVIFEVPDSGAFIIPELTSPSMTYNFYDKEIFGHVENDRFVFDTEGFYIVSAKWKCIPNRAAVSFDGTLQIVQADKNDNVSVLGEDDLRVDQHVDLSTTDTLTCTLWAKPGQGIQSRLFIPSSNSTNDVAILAWHVRIMKLPNTNEYQVQNAEYFGCYQREWVLSPAPVLPEDATKKFVNIDWTLGNTVNENPNALSIVPNKGVVPSRTGLVLLNFGLSVNVTQGTNVYDLICQVFRRNAAGQDVLVRTGTFRLYEGQINADLFNLVILTPMQEGDGVWFRILVPAAFNDLGYVASLSGTVFPSVIDQTVVHYKHQSYTEYQDGTKLSFPVTAKTWIDCPSEQFTSIGPFFDLFSVYENHWKVKRAGTYKITFCTSVPNSSITDAGYLCHIGILDMKGLVLGQYEIDYSNVPITDGIGTVECVKDFAEGEEFRTCFLYGKAGTAYVGKTIVSLLWLDADKNVIDIPDIDIFTTPTASASGKAGLVPGPAASRFPQNVILTADQFQEVDLAFMHPSPESAELNKTRIGLGGEGNETLNIDTLLRCGFFSAYTFSGTLPTADTGGFLLNCFTLGVIDRKYWGTQILVQTANTYVRRAQAGIDPGDTPVWGAWTTLNAPRPQAANGAGQWKNIELNASSYTLPQGHTWACQILGLRESDGRIVVAQAGVYAGGTVFNWSSAGVGTIVGFAWRITA